MKIKTTVETFKSFLFFWAGQLISLLGSSVAQFVIIWWITVETGSALYLSLAALVGFAPIVLLGPFTGVLVDRWSRRKLIGAVDFLQAITTTGLIFLFQFPHVSIWNVMALLALRGVFQAFHGPAVSAVMPLMVPEDKLSRLNGVNFLLTGIVNLVGPVIAALLLELWTISQILWVDAATFLVAVIPLFIIRIPSVVAKEKTVRNRSSFTAEFKEGLSFIKNGRGFLTFIMLATALNFLLTPTNLLPYFVQFEHSGGVSDLALVAASFQGGMLAGGILMSVIAGFKKKMLAIMVSIYIIFAGYALVALTPQGQFWFMAIGGIIMAFCIPVANVSIQTITQTVVPKNMFGRVSSVTGALASAASPIGMIISGIIAEYIGTAILFLGCVVLGVLISTLSWFFTDFKYMEKMGEKPAFNDNQK
ncbi:MAG: MFS transporter [Candidatus Bathyarchaeota archaeon]